MISRCSFQSLIKRAYHSSASKAPLLGRYKSAPVELFRINNGEQIRLRDQASQRKKAKSSYDVVIQPDGLVHPKAGDFFEGPNGASMRPNGHYLQEIVANFLGKNIVIYRLAKDTPLPTNLILLHEHSDHYSLQCNECLSLTSLNTSITEFLKNNAERMSVEEFERRFPYQP